MDAEAVVHAYDVDLDEQMNARGFWEEVTHPDRGSEALSRVADALRLADSPRGSGDRRHCSASTTTRCWGAWASPRTSWPVLAAEGIIGTRPAGA